MTRADSHHFDSPAERHHFGDVADIAENRCIECGSSSMGVDGQTTMGILFRNSDISKKYLSFPDVARNKRHAPCVPSDVGNRQLKFGGDQTHCYGDIGARAEMGSRWVSSAGNYVVAREVWKKTTA